MRPKKLCLCAWGPYPNREEIDFATFDDKGIFLITGATGAGKTTVFDAISYALYGALSGDERDKERNSVRSDFADAQMPTYVELTMEHGGQIYHIRRNPEYYRPKKRKSATEQEAGVPQMTKEKENAILTYPDGRIMEGVREVNGALQEILGLDYQQFKKISMIAQGEFARLLVAPPKEKTKIFREIFGTGIYERFAQGLGVRARRLYAKVMEHKAKLSEDIRLLGVDIGKRGWDDEIQRQFEELTETENRNYEEIAECLKTMEQIAAETVKVQKKSYTEADREVERRTVVLSEQEQMNKNIEQFRRVSEEQAQLHERAEEYEEIEKRIADARNAAVVEGAEAKIIQADRRLAENRGELERIGKEKELLLKESEVLNEAVNHADKIRELIHQKKLLSELEAERSKLRADRIKKNMELQKGQEHYLREEDLFHAAKTEYEQAEHRRKLAAIGLAAELLEKGVPCPVCGSLEHPNPAKTEAGIVSEEELKRLKDAMEEKSAALGMLHEKLITLKTQVEGMILQAEQTEAKIAEKEAVLGEEFRPVIRQYLEGNPEQALIELQQKCERAGKIVGLLQEKDLYAERLAVQAGQLELERKESSRLMQQLMGKYGFVDEEAYERAKLSAEEQELLQKDMVSYRNRVAANNELYHHLKEAVRGKEYRDLQQYRDALEEVRNLRDAALKEQKLWEQNLSEVKKTYKMMQEKLGLMREASDEYGYVKDLENMASGNNAKRLVFEQFVLAGYFEEILRAANLRLRKMTSGRYEMERTKEVGDGRVKDNLEIQVLDYYTGKYRSVRTLSGGESFKASLALALGMSDVIQAMNGGIRVDTLFVDEGFGALDEESLNQACDTLMALVEKNRLIGIISHVPELRERIDRQLVIDKTGSGSTVRNRV